MSTERRSILINSFVFETTEVPKSYGTLIPLGQFINEVDQGHHQPFMGSGYLVLNNKFIEGSEKWVSERFVPLELGYTLEELCHEIPELQVFWFSATDLLF